MHQCTKIQVIKHQYGLLTNVNGGSRARAREDDSTVNREFLNSRSTPSDPTTPSSSLIFFPTTRCSFSSSFFLLFTSPPRRPPPGLGRPRRTPPGPGRPRARPPQPPRAAPPASLRRHGGRLSSGAISATGERRAAGRRCGGSATPDPRRGGGAVAPWRRICGEAAPPS